MSKSANMLRTRRKDNNVKPNRRLDRKSSRGMLFENEELRLKTININAEVERGQSDIKKLKRENDQLRREIWYLRDEYDKLDKLLREKECQGPSSTSCTSESESCSTCSEESETVESSQNIENSQKTNLRKLNQEFDNLSIVPEENSTETSEKTSNLYQAQSPDTWNSENTDTDVIKPDQSYPVHKTQEEMPKYFFSPIKTTKVNEDYLNDQCMASNISNIGPICSQPIYSNAGFVTHSNYYPNVILPPLNKTTTDVIVKTDNQNFNTLKSQSSFSNGGNLEELLNDIETISHDILKMTHSQSSPPLHNCTASFPDYTAKNLGTNTNNEISQLTDTNINFPMDNYPTCDETDNIIPPDMPYKSELNVVLMPSPMQLIGIDKYKNLQKSCESLNTKSNENVSNLSQVLNTIPEATSPNLATVSSNNLYAFPSQQQLFQPFVPVPPMCPNPNVIEERVHQDLIKEQQETPPFFFEESSEYFTARYIPETSATQTGDNTKKNKQLSKQCNKEFQKKDEIYSSKANLLDTTHSSDHISSENEDPLKLKNLPDNTADNRDSKRSEGSKSSKPSIRGKVSIHFKGKKDKSKEQKHNDIPKSPTQDRKHPTFDLKFTSETKDKKSLKKTPSIESKISNAANEPKTPSGEPKPSTSDNRNCKVDSKNVESSSNSMPELKMSDSKNRKSSSASPEHKQGHKESTKKCHRKHKKSDKNKFRKGSLTLDRYHRERSYSICTDRSNILDRRLGQYGYDEFTTSERERTNSLSSCDTLKGRELSNVSHFPTGKIPWCACWGNGCL